MFFKVIDDFLHKTYFKEMQQSLESDEFPWYFNKNITYNNEEADNVFQDFGFTHWFVHEENGLTDTQLSHFMKPFISQIMDTIDYNKVLRARADMVTWTQNNFLHEAHQDFAFPHKACVFYINQSDGDTVFYNVTKNDYNDKCKIQERVSPKPNRLVIFDGDLMHSGHSPSQHKRRIIINSNFIKVDN
jgi:hypothetical protein|tara:strand:- start:320 stop:883 length:564 start_codon:yes stop_codon:yes gene_type:complete